MIIVFYVNLNWYVFLSMVFFQSEARTCFSLSFHKSSLKKTLKRKFHDLTHAWREWVGRGYQNEENFEICTLRREIFAGINFREFFPGHFAGINFRELGFIEDFAGINFRESSLTKDMARIKFCESALYKDFAGVNLTFGLKKIFPLTLVWEQSQ